LRSVMLGNGSHFRALIRSKHAWIIYGGMGVTDGLMPSARFEFVPLDDLARAQGDYHCNTALYEVLDAEETRTFGNPDFDITKTLVHSPDSFIPTCFAESDGEEEEESDGEEEEDEDCEFNEEGDEDEELEQDSLPPKKKIAAPKKKATSPTKKKVVSPKKKETKENLKDLTSEIKSMQCRKSERVPIGWSVKKSIQKRGR